MNSYDPLGTGRVVPLVVLLGGLRGARGVPLEVLFGGDRFCWSWRPVLLDGVHAYCTGIVTSITQPLRVVGIKPTTDWSFGGLL